MVRRFFKAFRVAFWEALYQETRRHTYHGGTLKVHVETDEALAAIAAIDARLTALASKALTVDSVMCRFAQSRPLGLGN